MAHNVTTLAYLAGAIDSDGCITILRLSYSLRLGQMRAHTYNEYVSLHQASPEIVDFMKETFGGWRWEKKAKGRHRKMYEWRLEAAKAAQVLRTLLPYLRIKRRQAEICLRLHGLKQQAKKRRVFIEIPNRWGGTTRLRRAVLSDEQKTEREQLWQEVRSLNMSNGATRKPRLLGVT